MVSLSPACLCTRSLVFLQRENLHHQTIFKDATTVSFHLSPVALLYQHTYTNGIYEPYRVSVIAAHWESKNILLVLLRGPEDWIINHEVF